MNGLFSLKTDELIEHQQYLNYFNLTAQLMQQSRSITEADSAQIQFLTGLLNNSNGVVAGYARNILVAKGFISYQEPYILPQTELKSSNILHKSTKDQFNSSKLKIYPNPSSDYIVIEYTLKSEPVNAMIKIFDVNGKVIHSIPLDGTHDYLVVPVVDLPSGSYLCSILLDDKPIQNAKFIVVK